MVDQTRVLEFVDAALNGHHADAIRSFYQAEASMRENLAKPRRGRERLISHEEPSLARIQAIVTHPPCNLLIEKDTVLIKRIFDIADHNGSVRRLQEISMQRWEGGLIAEKRFFSDNGAAWAPAKLA